MRNFLNTIFFIVVILFCVVFALSNAQSIQLRLFGLALRPLPVSLLVLIPFLLGVVLGSILNLGERFSLRREVKRLKRELEGYTQKREEEG